MLTLRTNTTQELHQLLENTELQKLPLLILANKIDLGPKISEQDLITGGLGSAGAHSPLGPAMPAVLTAPCQPGLNLDYVMENPWLVIPISAKDGTNVEQASIATAPARPLTRA